MFDSRLVNAVEEEDKKHCVANGIQLVTSSVKLLKLRPLHIAVRVLFHPVLIFVRQLIQSGMPSHKISSIFQPKYH